MNKIKEFWKTKKGKLIILSFIGILILVVIIGLAIGISEKNNNNKQTNITPNINSIKDTSQNRIAINNAVSSFINQKKYWYSDSDYKTNIHIKTTDNVNNDNTGVKFIAKNSKYYWDIKILSKINDKWNTYTDINLGNVKNIDAITNELKKDSLWNNQKLYSLPTDNYITEIFINNFITNYLNQNKSWTVRNGVPKLCYFKLDGKKIAGSLPNWDIFLQPYLKSNNTKIYSQFELKLMIIQKNNLTTNLIQKAIMDKGYIMDKLNIN